MPKITLPLIRNGSCITDDASWGASSANVFQEISRMIGGIGKTLRWKFVNGKRYDKDPIQVLFWQISDREAFQTRCVILEEQRVVQGVESIVFEYIDELTECGTAYGWCAMVVVNNPWHVINVAFYLNAHLSCRYVIQDASRSFEYEVAIERMDRTEFTFWDQDDTTAAPKQSWYKWDFSWLDPSWTVLPFTWSRLACNIPEDRPIASVPDPLRFHVASRRVQTFEQGHPIHEAARPHAAENSFVTSALTREQTRELLWAHVQIRLNRGNDALITQATCVLRSYIEYGYTSRLVGPYKQAAEYVGRGIKLRKFKHLAQYDFPRLSNSVMNRIYQVDGTVVGTGKGKSRSKHKKRRTAAPRKIHNDVTYHDDIRTPSLRLA